MSKFESKVVINAKPAAVWKYMNDPSNLPKWLTNLEMYEHKSGTMTEVGSKGTLHYNDSGRKYQMDEEVIESKQNEYVKQSLKSKQLDLLIENRLQPIDGDKTELTAISEFTRKSMMMKVMMAMFMPPKKIQKELDDQAEKLKSLIEQA